MATLYLTEQGTTVRYDHETLVVVIPAREDGTPRRKVRVPLIRVDRVVVYGNITLTTPALAALLARRAEVCLCTRRGRFLGRLHGPDGKNSLLRLEQYRAHDDPDRALVLAKAFVAGKLANMRTMLLRANRKRNDPAVGKAVDRLKELLEQVEGLKRDPTEAGDRGHPQAGTAYGTLLGLEGAGTATYFGVFSRLLREDWGFSGRQRRPPTDPVNALLSFGYVVLMNQVVSAVFLVGMDPYVGFLHSSQYGKPALALDVMEIFRPLVTDSVVLTVLNNGMLKREDFREEFGTWRLSDEGRRRFLEKLEERLDTEIEHPVFGYKATYRRVLELEIRLVARWLMGEIPVYRPFTVR